MQQHPQDVAARLDLAQRYRDAGMTGLASLQYTEAIRLDPTNAEALTGMAFVLFDSGRSREALAEVDRALAVDATYPEALYEKGLILLRGLQRPGAGGRAAHCLPVRRPERRAPLGGRDDARRDRRGKPTPTPSPSS